MMNEQNESPPTQMTPDARGHRVLHVLLPPDVFNHVKAQAALSGLAFRHYIERFLREAHPYADKHDANEGPKPSGAEDDLLTQQD